jgi:hypothetical protein
MSWGVIFFQTAADELLPNTASGLQRLFSQYVFSRAPVVKMQRRHFLALYSEGIPFDYRSTYWLTQEGCIHFSHCSQVDTWIMFLK